MCVSKEVLVYCKFKWLLYLNAPTFIYLERFLFFFLQYLLLPARLSYPDFSRTDYQTPYGWPEITDNSTNIYVFFSQFVFNNAFCTNTAVQPLFLVYRCCYGFLHGDSHWCFPVTGNCFQCAILCIVVEVVSVYLGSTFIIVALLDQD